MANDTKTIKEHALIPEGAEVSISPDFCDLMPEHNKRAVREWLKKHPEFEAAVWIGESSPRRTLQSEAAARLFGAEFWSVTELFRRIYVAACPEREHTVDRRSPGFHARNIWVYEGLTIRQVAEQAQGQ